MSGTRSSLQSTTHLPPPANQNPSHPPGGQAPHNGLTATARPSESKSFPLRTKLLTKHRRPHQQLIKQIVLAIAVLALTPVSHIASPTQPDSEQPAADSAPSHSSPPHLAGSTARFSKLATSRAYAIEVDGDSATFTLDFERSEANEYLLVVSSLGDSLVDYEITISAAPAPSAAALAGHANVHPLGHQPARITMPPGPYRPVGRLRKLATRRTNRSRPAAGQRPWLTADPHADGPFRLVKLRPHEDQQPALDTRVFYIHVTNGPLNDPDQYVAVVGRRIAAGSVVDIYLDSRERVANLDDGLAEFIVRAIERQIGPALAEQFGSCHDINGDGRFAVLLTPWLSQLQGGRTRLKGFVRSTDFDANGPSPFSNRCDMLYLNSELSPGGDLQALIAHELTHAISLCERARFSDRLGAAPEDDWLNEGVAHIAENLLSDSWDNLDHRIHDYLEAPHRYPLAVADYYGAGLWRNHGCRGATYLFMRWCVDTFDNELLRRLVQTPSVGRRNLELASGNRFEDLFRSWTIALAESRSGSPDESFTAADNVARPSIAPIRSASPGTWLTINHRSSPSLHPLRSLSLHGTLGEFQLDGPQAALYAATPAAWTTQQRGTTARFIQLQAPHSGRQRFTVQAEPGCRLQLTVIRLAAEK